MATASQSRKFTAKQAAFAREYLVDANATQAAICASYNPKSAQDLGLQFRRNHRVASAIAERQAIKTERTEITAEYTLFELAILDFSDIIHYRIDDACNVTLAPDVPPHAMCAVRSVKHRVRTISVSDDGEVEREHQVEYTLWDKNTALTNLAKHFRLLIDRFEVVGPVAEEVKRLAAERGLTCEEGLAEAQALASGRFA